MITRDEIDSQKLVSDAFSFEALAKRLNFVSKSPDVLDNEAEVPAETKTANVG
jgi:hypothetical protein